MRASRLRTGVLGSALLIAWALSGVAEAKHKHHDDPADQSDKDDDADDDAAPKEFRFDFGLVGGAHFFDSQSGLGRYTDSPANLSPKTAVAVGGRLGLNFNHYLTLEGEVLWIPTRTVLDPGGTKLNVFAYRGSLLVHLAPPGIVRPFLLAGYGGLTSISNDDNVVPGDTDGYLHAGVGLKIAFGDYVGLRLDGRVLAPPAFLGSKTAVGDETGYHGPDLEALGTLYFNFGEVERIEVVREERVVVEKRVPAPNPDPDGDGISGAADKCPDQAEDKDGFEDADGCPDPDNDKDGIPDVDDKCPNEPETKNGYKDDDGCPDELPPAIKRFTGVIEGINFKSGRAVILPGSYAVLDRAVAVLKEYPDVRLEISGHTDSRGKADHNRDLSQLRADAVKTYFISRGIDANRLTSIGYGADRPVDTNATDAGRARNRRTEFRLLTGKDGNDGG